MVVLRLMLLHILLQLLRMLMPIMMHVLPLDKLIRLRLEYIFSRLCTLIPPRINPSMDQCRIRFTREHTSVLSIPPTSTSSQ